MLAKRIAAVLIVIVGLGFFYVGHAEKRRGSDKAYWAKVADHGGISALNGSPPSSIYFVAAFASLVIAGTLWKR